MMVGLHRGRAWAGGIPAVGLHDVEAWGALVVEEWEWDVSGGWLY